MGVKLVTREQEEKARQKHYEKQRAASERQREKLRLKIASPEYRETKLEQAKRQQEKSRQRQIVKLSDPQYIERQQLRKKASIKRSLEKVKAKPPANKMTDTKNPAKKPSKSKGLMGRTPTVSERKLMDKIGALPCVACKVMGNSTNTHIALHHVDGRVKEFAHAKVLPLCAYHHDLPLTPEERAIHGDVYPVHAKGSYGGKKVFENEYGTQEHLLSLVYLEIGEQRPWLVPPIILTA